MRPGDLLLLGIKGMSERKLRTALTVLSIVIGVAAIVALVSLVAGVSASVSSSLQSIGPSTIYMTPSLSHIFTAADIAEIGSLPNVSSAIPIIRFSANITSGGQQLTATVMGIDNQSLAKAIGSVNLYDGSIYQNSPTPLAVVGYSLAFPNSGQTTPSMSVDEPIYLTEHSGSTTKIITLIPTGLLNAYGTSSFISPDSSIFISLQEAESLLSKYSYSIILVQASNVTDVAPLYSLLKTIYGSNAQITSVQQIAATVSQITGSLGLLLGAIAGISLLVAGISILSIMMVSVSERTHEIGILKSIGFRRKDILFLFLSEALVIGLLGGIIGVAVGAGASHLVASIGSLGGSRSTTSAAPSGGFVAGSGSGFGGGAGARGASAAPTTTVAPTSITPVVSPEIIAVAIFVAVLVSLLASFYPAWKASTIDPIKALRTE